VVHPDNFTSIATDPFDPEQVTDYIRPETELSFLHVKTTISNRDWLRQVRLAICKTRRQVAATCLEAAAGSENPYAYVEVFGCGHMSTRTGAAVYIMRCNPMSVQPRAVLNCTSEVPVLFNGTDMFVDPISYVLRTHAVPIKCTDVAPPRFNIGGRWYCLIENRGLPISPVDIGHDGEEKWGLGCSIYSKEQLNAFHEFQMAAAVRAAYVPDPSWRSQDAVQVENGDWD
jgi:hypothetical protein